MPNSHTPEQLARYNEHERIEYWIRRGKALEVARDLAAAPPGTCALCGEKSIHSRARVCRTCAAALAPDTDVEQMAAFRRHERYRYHRRRGVSHEEALALADRATNRGTCQICGKAAYSKRAEICEEHRKEADAERAERSRKNQLAKVRSCATCGAEFAGKKGTYCPDHRYGHNAGKTYKTGSRELKQIHLGGPSRKATPTDPARPIVFTPPQPAPVHLPPAVTVQKLPPVGLAARSFRDYLHD